MLRNLSIVLILTAAAVAQEPSKQPQVKVNVLNVCSPSPEEKQEIANALAKVPKQPLFGTDFEVARGRSTLEDRPEIAQATGVAVASSDSATASWVRIRREFAVQSLFSTVQYSFSTDPKNLVETIVFRVRDPKDLLQLSIEDSASTVVSPATMLSTSTPASRIKLERFGKSSVVLARCFATEGSPPPDQSAYEPLFQSASSVLSNYRGLLDARRMVPDELDRVTGQAKPKSKTVAPASPRPK